MKNLLLTSSGSFITRFDIKEFVKPLREMKMAYIITASKKVDDVSYVEKHKEAMDEQGFNYEEIDIAEKQGEELKDILKDKEVIFVEGGNTFYLLKCIRESGFEKIVKELIGQGIIYVGSSAGSYVAGATIETATVGRHDHFDDFGITDYTAMNLVPFLIKAHFNVYDSEKGNELKEKLKKFSHPVRFLTDDQAILVKGDDVRILGKGEEIIL